MSDLEHLIKARKKIGAKCPELKQLYFGAFIHVQKDGRLQLLRFLLEKEIEGKPCYQLMAEDGDVMWISKKDFNTALGLGRATIIGHTILLSHVLKALKTTTVPDWWDMDVHQLEGQEVKTFEVLLSRLDPKHTKK